MKNVLILTVLSLIAVTNASAECPSLDTLKEITVSLALQEKRGEPFSKEIIPQIIECAELLQEFDYKIAPQILEVATRLLG